MDTSTVAARHLLIKFAGSRNPVSRRTNASTASVTAEEAIKELEEYAAKIQSEGATEAGKQSLAYTLMRADYHGQSPIQVRCHTASEFVTCARPSAVFAKYAKERSDCGSFQNGGDLGQFGPGEMQKQFEDGTR